MSGSEVARIVDQIAHVPGVVAAAVTGGKVPLAAA